MVCCKFLVKAHGTNRFSGVPVFHDHDECYSVSATLSATSTLVESERSYALPESSVFLPLFIVATLPLDRQRFETYLSRQGISDGQPSDLNLIEKVNE